MREKCFSLKKTLSRQELTSYPSGRSYSMWGESQQLLQIDEEVNKFSIH